MTRQPHGTLIAATVLTLVLPAAAGMKRQRCTAAGVGKQLVEHRCTGCHQTNMITQSSGYTREDWTELVSTMIDLSSVPEDREAIPHAISPRISRRTPRVRPSDARAPCRCRSRNVQTPTLGQRTRDPVQAADGLIWWAGQFGNLIGSLNPATGAMKEYPLPANALPHRRDRCQGHIWYTGNKNGSVGSLDPSDR